MRGGGEGYLGTIKPDLICGAVMARQQSMVASCEIGIQKSDGVVVFLRIRKGD